MFDEQEYPAIDLGELEFECTDDLDKMREYLKQPVDNDSDRLIMSYAKTLQYAERMNKFWYAFMHTA